MADFPKLREALQAAYAKTQHDAAVLEEATAWKNGKNVVKVYADLEAWEKPPELGGFIPDIFVQGRLSQVAVEVETQDSLTNQHTQDQVAAFRAWERAAPGRRFELKVV